MNADFGVVGDLWSSNSFEVIALFVVILCLK